MDSIRVVGFMGLEGTEAYVPEHRYFCLVILSKSVEPGTSSMQPIKTKDSASSSYQRGGNVGQGRPSAVAAHALSLEDSGVLFDSSPPPRGSSRLPPSGARPGAAFGPGQQFSASDMSLGSKFSSGSGGGLDRAIDAARANDEAEDDEDHDMDAADVRFLRSGISIDSSEARSLRSFSLSTPFAAPQLQCEGPRDIASRVLRDLVPGSESLSLDEQDLYKHLVKELQSDGTLSSEISELLNDVHMSLSDASASSSEEQLEVQREKVEEVVQRLRSRLPADKAAQLSSFDSYGLLDLYNHHHSGDPGSRQGAS